MPHVLISESLARQLREALNESNIVRKESATQEALDKLRAEYKQLYDAAKAYREKFRVPTIYDETYYLDALKTVLVDIDADPYGAKSTVTHIIERTKRRIQAIRDARKLEHPTKSV